MTSKANARIAGFMFLFYIATGLTDMALSGRASGGEGTVERLATMAQHAPLVRVSAVLVFLTFVDAVVLAVALFGLTRDQDRDLAVLALSARLGEGVLNAVAAIRQLTLLSVATASVAAAPPDAAAAQALGALLLKEGNGSFLVGASCFAIGSTTFAYLFLRARSIPVWLAWVGVLGSLLVLAGLLLQMAGVLHGLVTGLMWIPVGVFEVVLGFWLLIKGVRVPEARRMSF